MLLKAVQTSLPLQRLAPRALSLQGDLGEGGPVVFADGCPPDSEGMCSRGAWTGVASGVSQVCAGIHVGALPTPREGP